MHGKGVEGVTNCAAALVRFLRNCPSSDYATLSQFNGTAAIEQQCADAMAVFTTLIPVLRIVAADNLPSGVLQGVGVSWSIATTTDKGVELVLPGLSYILIGPDGKFTSTRDFFDPSLMPHP
eukprot:m.48236 g.48236  ORF g.48236 m.48236 type:complete len:122 (+) comp15813_c0_seq2:386-751(+)